MIDCSATISESVHKERNRDRKWTPLKSVPAVSMISSMCCLRLFPSDSSNSLSDIFLICSGCAGGSGVIKQLYPNNGFYIRCWKTSSFIFKWLLQTTATGWYGGVCHLWCMLSVGRGLCSVFQFWKTDRVAKSGKTTAISLNIFKYFFCTLIIYQPSFIDRNF